jgi:hypothetical protein
MFMRVRTVLIRSISLTFSRASSLAQAGAMIGCIFTDFSFGAFADGSFLSYGIGAYDYAILICAVAVLWWVSLMQERGESVGGMLARKPLFARWAVYIASVVAIALLSADVGAGEVNFIYGRF